jgi:hypothetical protein
MLKSLPQGVILHNITIHEHQLYTNTLNISNIKDVLRNVITRTRKLKPFLWWWDQTMMLSFTADMFVGSPEQTQQKNRGI